MHRRICSSGIVVVDEKSPNSGFSARVDWISSERSWVLCRNQSNLDKLISSASHMRRSHGVAAEQAVIGENSRTIRIEFTRWRGRSLLWLRYPETDERFALRHDIFRRLRLNNHESREVRMKP